MEDESRRDGIHVRSLQLDLRIIRRNRIGNLVPEHHGVLLCIRFGDGAQAPATSHRLRKGIAKDSLSAFSGEHGSLHCHLIGTPPMDSAARSAVLAFRILPYTQDIEIRST